MKVLLVATVQSHICQFHRPLVQILHAYGCEVHVAARDNLAEKSGLRLDFADKVFNIPFERSPFSQKNISAYRQLRQLIEREQYQVVHTNTPVGGVLGRLAARKVRKKGTTVLYTAHGFHFYKGGSAKNWMIYYPIEKIMCRHTDVLLTICQEDYDLARSGFEVSAERIHGVGANTERFFKVSAEEKMALREQLKIGAEEKVILCAGELNANKNQILAIWAMQQVVEAVPDACLYLAGNGPAKESLEAAIKDTGLEDHVKLVGYRTDLNHYMQAADLIVSCSKREGLGLNIIEGMLCGKPVVATVNRGHRELVMEGKNGYLSDIADAASMAEKITRILLNEALTKDFGEAGYEIAQAYTDVAVKKELEEIYKKIILG